MWEFVSHVLSQFWFGFSNASGVGIIVIAAVAYTKDKLDQRSNRREEERLSRSSIAAMDADLFGASEGNDGRHA